jgi:prealbumin domain-containing protein
MTLRSLAGAVCRHLWGIFASVSVSAVLALAPAPAQAAQRSPDLNVCAWGYAQPIPCQGDRWVEGNPMGEGAYKPGEFVPFRVIFRPDAPGGAVIHRGHTYRLELGYDIARSSLIAYDYLGTYNASPRGDPNEPCSGAGVPTEGPNACGNAPSTAAVPADVHSFFADGQHPPSGGHLHQFSAWGVELLGATQVSCPNQGGEFPRIDARQPIPSGAQPRCVELRFHVPGSGDAPAGAVIAWGAHIAREADWGTGKTYAASGDGGAQFHMRLVSNPGTIDGESGFNLGNEEISLQTVPRPTLTTLVSHSIVHPGGSVIDIARLTGSQVRPTGTVDFFLCFAASGPPPPDCGSGGTLVRHGEPVVESSDPRQGTAEVEVSGTDTERVGFYCFRAEYNPGTAPFLPTTHTNRILGGECFEVRQTQLTVDKVCVPETDTGHFDVHIVGVGASAGFDRTVTSVACGHGTGAISVPPGTYMVSETAHNNNPHAYPNVTFGGACQGPPAGEVTVALGESRTCTITNAREPTGQLLVNKVCVPADDTGRFVVVIGNSRFELTCQGDESTTGLLTLAPGSHTVREESSDVTSVGDYVTEFSGACTARNGSPPTASVDVIADETVTCTITNTLKQSTLEVTKSCVPENSGGKFNITVSGATGDTTHTVACGHTTGPIPVTPNAGYRVAEAGADGTNLAAYESEIGGACDPGGHVIVPPGEHRTCEISNVRRNEEAKVGDLTLLKVCVPETDGGRFNLQVAGVTAADAPCGGRVGPLKLAAGSYHVGETAGAGTDLSNYQTVIGGACSADGSVHLTAGRSETCTITNIRHGAATAVLTVRKLCRPAHDNGRFSLDINEQNFRGIRCGQSIGPVTVATGTNLVGEVAAPPGLTQRYDIRIGGACAANGTVTLKAHQHATCTVTNIRRRPALGGVTRPRPPHRPRPPKPPPFTG